jgi:hypothetical protein
VIPEIPIANKQRRKGFLNILLAGGTFAFLALTMDEALSTGGTQPTVNSFAQNTINTIFGDLQQEMSDGSTVAPYSGATVYIPNSNLTAVPALAGFTPTISAGYENDGLTNLLKRSAYGIPFHYTRGNLYSQAGVSRASAVNSITASLDGHAITPVRWNEHLLLGRANTSSPTDYTPVSNFTAPDWILVAKDNSNPMALNSTLTQSGSNPVTGRYAYAIYNEGGLLDMNVAGYPTGMTQSQTSYKSLEAFADLTQLGLTQNQVDQIVGWRNSATAQPGGSFPNYTFTPAAATNYYNSVLNNPTGFLSPISANGLSDQQFISRQQLLGVAQSLNISPDIMQYLGTFTRSLEQPSNFPDPNRPKIYGPNSPPPPSTLVNNYVGNNDAVNADATVNPAFQSIRVTSPFTRFNGTTAVVGEPLVKYKFALSQLAMVAYNDSNNSNMPTGFTPTASDPDPIYDHFGLYRTGSELPWVYNHTGNAGSTNPTNHILTLSQVSALNREPDFAELLKASILAGSIAKGAPNENQGQSNYQYAQDSLVDLQVLQIMANLIDQQDSDSYSTNIEFANAATGQTAQIYGVEDLPYFYRFHVLSVVDQLPSPVVSANSAAATVDIGTSRTTFSFPGTQGVNFPSGSATTIPSTIFTESANGTTASIANIVPITSAQAANFNAGEVTYLLVPDVWNPHDPNSMLNENAALRPTNFRIFYTTADPGDMIPPFDEEVGTEITYPINGTTTPILNFEKILPETNGTNPPTTYYWPISTQAGIPMSEHSFPGTNTTNSLSFSDMIAGNIDLFREPTLLWNNNDPTGINLNVSGNIAVPEPNTGKTYYGLIFGKAPISRLLSVVSTPAKPTDGSYVAQAQTVNPLYYLTGSGQAQFSFFLQYQDAFGNWVTYDTKYADQHGLTPPPPAIVDTADFSANNSWKNPTLNNQWAWNISSMDPRTARWGISVGSTIGNDGGSNRHLTPGINIPPFLEPQISSLIPYWGSSSSSANQSIESTNFSILQTNRPVADAGDFSAYSNPCNLSLTNENLQMRFFSPNEYSLTAPQTGSARECNGMFSQNDSTIESTLLSANGSSPNGQNYYEDPDGIDRLGMAAYATKTLNTTDSPIGMPLATANTYSAENGIGTPTSQSQSRPLVLNRPFRSVSDMSYAFTGTPWKSIDFFTPASGDTALLDTFCVNAPPAGGMVAGKVDLNTRQAPVLQALIAGAYRDETNNAATPPSYSLPPLTGTEASLVASKLVNITTDTIQIPSDNWRGPLENVSWLVGHYVNNPTLTTAADEYTYVPPTPLASGEISSATYAGLSAVLDNTVYTNPANSANLSTYKIQRMREAGIRPLADCGQTRVWNLLIDVIAQTGSYPDGSTSLSGFSVNGEHHYWQHVAIDRLTGQILDQSIEEVSEAPNDILSSNLTINGNVAAGTTIGTLSALPGSTFTFTLVSGPGGTDNADFTISGNTLQAATTLNSTNQSTYSILVQATNPNGQSYQQTLTISTVPSSMDTPTMPTWALGTLALLLLAIGYRFLPGIALPGNSNRNA